MRSAVGLICYVGGIAALLFSFYYFFSFLGGVKPEKKKYLPLFGPAIFFIPSLTDKEGNRAARNFILSMLAFAFFCGVLYFMFPRQS